MIESVGSICAFFCAPLGVNMREDSFDHLLGITKIVFVKFLNILFFYAVNDALDSYVCDCLLEVKCLLEFLSSA